MDIEINGEYQRLQEMLDINRKLLQIHRKRLTDMGFTEAQIKLRMAPLMSLYEKVQAEMEKTVYLVLAEQG